MKNDQKTLVIITPAFPANEAETYWVPSQQSLVKSLKKNFPEIDIVVLAYFYPYQKYEYNWHQVKVKSFDGKKLSFLKKFFLFRKIWGTLKKINHQKNIIGILSFWCREGALIGKRFGKKYNIKHRCWVCGQDARKSNHYVKWISPGPTDLIAISDFISEEFFRNHRLKPATVVPNAIDTDLFEPELNQDRDVDCLAVGSLIPLKQFDIFVSVVKQLKGHFPEIKAIICGDGEEKENLVNLVEKFGLGNNITILNAMKREEALKLMSRSKILLHPSSFEGFSTVCLEALYAGARVISFTKPMNFEIKHWNVVKTENDMIEKSLEILNGRGLIHERVLIYSIDDTAQKMIQLFS